MGSFYIFRNLNKARQRKGQWYIFFRVILLSIESQFVNAIQGDQSPPTLTNKYPCNMRMIAII